ncbi:unnamed protein product [Allacma fusca]|uniref:Amidase domain-containing protein n=1 Tax=Allacma fusca TaxID=39272 RepID=A0A8J2IYT6_9HEXA|nr:unnamed protein product [Allacma fusca]
MTKIKLLFQNIYLILFCVQTFPVVIDGLVFDGCVTETCHQFAGNRARKQHERIQVLNELRNKFSISDGNHWIGDLNFQELIKQLQTRRLSAVQVLSTFIGRAVNATDEFNCVSEFIPDAMKWAIELDNLPHLKGPLHGVPFSHFNGICTITSTPRRLSVEGIQSAIPKLVGLNGVPAILADKPSTLTTIYKALTENNIQSHYDPTTVPLPWRPQLFEDKRPLRFGYFTSMPFFPTLGDTPLVIEETKRRLEALGHTVVPFEMPDGYVLMKTFLDILFADRAEYLFSQLEDDQIATSNVLQYSGLKIPALQRKLASTLPVTGKQELLLKLGLDSEKSTGLQTTVDVGKRLQKYILQQMQDLNLDQLLTPVFPVPALRLDDPAKLFIALCYVSPWNLVEFPAGVIPMGIESGQNVDAVDTSGDVFLNLAKTNLLNAIGMPIGVQIVGRPFQEELILRTLQELESSSKYYSFRRP